MLFKGEQLYLGKKLTQGGIMILLTNPVSLPTLWRLEIEKKKKKFTNEYN